MSFRITTQPAEAVIAGWAPSKARRYTRFEAQACRIAARHGLSLQAIADALLALHDLHALYTWAEAGEFLPVLCTTHGSPTAG